MRRTKPQLEALGRPSPATGRTPSSGAFRARPARILVVEDSSFVRRLLTVTLSDRGHVVEAVADCVAALALVESVPFDLAVVDRALDGCDGLEVCRRLAALPVSHRPVTLLCSVSFKHVSEGRAAARDCGAAAFVPKDAGLKSLLRAIDDALVALDEGRA